MSDDRAMRQLQDEAAIRNVIARFAEAAMLGDYEGFRHCWAKDAVWTIRPPVDATCRGEHAIVALLLKLRENRAFFVQYAVPGPIRIHGDEASVRCLCHEAARGPGEVYYRNHAFFHDRLRREGDGWRFTHRDYDYIWLDTSPFGGDAFPPAAIAG